jgi:hypothetical protein
MMAQFSKKDMRLLDRHYLKIKIFGRIWYIWNTSPRAVLEHLKEVMPCDGDCGMNYCDENGCPERKRILTTHCPPDAYHSA